MSFLDPKGMQDLLQSNQNLDLTKYQSTPLCQNNFGPRKSNLNPLFFFQNPTYITYIIFARFLFLPKSQTRNSINIKKNYTYPLVLMILDHGRKSSMRCSFADAMIARCVFRNTFRCSFRRSDVCSPMRSVFIPRCDVSSLMM